MDQYLLERLSRESEEEVGIKNGELLNRKIYSSGEDFVVSEARLFGAMSDISVRTHTRYTDFPPHKHNFVEMMIVLGGSITHRIEGESVTLTKGQMLILNKHISHSIDRSSEGDIGVNIIMSDRFISSMTPELSGTVFSSLIKENGKDSGEPMYLYFDAEGHRRVENLIENLLLELTDELPDTAIMSKTVSLLLDCLSRAAGECLISGSVWRDKESERRLEILNYVKGNYRTASLTGLAERLYLSVPYLSRLVKEYFGKSFKELVVDERMARARELFLTTNMPIGDVIRGVGYENESYFHREFKRREGTTPLGVRKLKVENGR